MASVRRIRPAVVLAGGAAAVVLGVAASLTVGVFRVPLPEVARVLVDALLGRRDGSAEATLVLDVRLPRALGAVAVGAAFATAGAMLQALLRNPLASPFVIGTAQAAGFGAVTAIALGLGGAAVLGAAGAAAVLALALVLALARTPRSLPTEGVVLTGLAVSLLFGAGTGLVRYLVHDEAAVGRITLWVLGGLWHVTWASVAGLAPVALVGVVVTGLLWRRLDLLALGAEDAARLGLDVRQAGAALLLLACALTASAVCLGGVVAFVGLVVPHVARRVVGPAHDALLPASAALGALFVLGADALARTALPPEELPLGVVTSLIGVPVFLVLLRGLRARGGDR